MLQMSIWPTSLDITIRAGQFYTHYNNRRRKDKNNCDWIPGVLFARWRSLQFLSALSVA